MTGWDLGAGHGFTSASWPLWGCQSLLAVHLAGLSMQGHLHQPPGPAFNASAVSLPVTWADEIVQLKCTTTTRVLVKTAICGGAGQAPGPRPPSQTPPPVPASQAGLLDQLLSPPAHLLSPSSRLGFSLCSVVTPAYHRRL